MSKDLLDTVLDEQRFPYEGMSREERNHYLNIIKNCKDISDSENKVDNKSKCEIVQLCFRRKDSIVNVNGSLSIGSENRCIDADIFFFKDSIVVNMLITRLRVQVEPKEYRVLDEFKLDNDILKRRSQYNYNMTSIFDNIENEEMKGRLK